MPVSFFVRLASAPSSRDDDFRRYKLANKMYLASIVGQIRTSGNTKSSAASTVESTFAQGSIPATRPPHSLTPTATFTQSSIPATRPPQSLKPTATVPQPSTSVGGPEQFISPSTLLTSQWSKQEMAHKTTLLLLDLTRTYQSIYFRNKTAFYQKVQQEFRNKGYTLSADKIRKKLGNLLTTYKSAKDRRRATGEAKVTWEYYTQMDDLFGTSGVGSAPPGTKRAVLHIPYKAKQSCERGAAWSLSKH
ncbi:hypothetical protein AMEX_G23244 [Astyanax mexicanus]|uniref:Myb/SANT-like DNA-binding domain-containing protein n=1 Tax=Astyanax mexicanus TaxID=7994 RepID=A0A8T2KZI4_ASTMX|nr:hypothetical protein AMEX_G23244 [Astyanax mexicanus]